MRSLRIRDLQRLKGDIDISLSYHIWGVGLLRYLWSTRMFRERDVVTQDIGKRSVPILALEGCSPE